MSKRRKFSAEFERGAVEQLSQGQSPLATPPPPRRRGAGAAQTQAGPGKAGAGFCTRSGDVLCQGVVLRYQAIERCRDDFPVRLMCRCPQVSPSGYYDWSGRQPSHARSPSVACLCASERFTKTVIAMEEAMRLKHRLRKVDKTASGS